jgi:hypothetical protein
MAHSTESLDGGAHGLNYWRQSDIRFLAFTAISLYYRVEFGARKEPFPFEFRLYASALQGGIHADGTLERDS